MYKECYYSIRLLDKLAQVSEERSITLDFDMIKKGISFAKKYHDGQFRKSGEAYYTHPLEVAYMISDYFDNLFQTNVIVASILHDVVEDTEATIGDILNHFGFRVAQMVDMLTRDRPDGTKLSVEDILFNACQKDDKEVLCIKVIDRLHNMQTMKNGDKKYLETLQYVNIVCLYLDNIEIFKKFTTTILEQNSNDLTKKYLKNLNRKDFSSNYHLSSLIFQDNVY